MIPDDEQDNYELFRDALSSTLLQTIALDAPKGRRRAKGRQKTAKSRDILGERTKISRSENAEDDSVNNDAEDLAEFIDVCSRSFLPILRRALDHIYLSYS